MMPDQAPSSPEGEALIHRRRNKKSRGCPSWQPRLFFVIRTVMHFHSMRVPPRLVCPAAAPPPHPLQISICAPSSNTRLGCIPKEAMGVWALRDMKAKNALRQAVMRELPEVRSVSRPRK